MSESTAIKDPVTASWNLRISSADFEKLKGGFMPTDMEDKWKCSVDKPDQQGTIIVHWCRSWTSTEVTSFRVTPLRDGAEIVDITWERVFAGIEVSQTEAKERVTNLCQGYLDIEWANGA